LVDLGLFIVDIDRINDTLSHYLWLNRPMTAKFILRKQIFEIKNGMTIRKALQKLNIEPDSVLATRNGELLTDDEIIKEGDEIKLIPVISGG
jgi:sulfur carrier protein